MMDDVMHWRMMRTRGRFALKDVTLEDGTHWRVMYIGGWYTLTGDIHERGMVHTKGWDALDDVKH
jgi:hypothetical protein